MLCSKISFVFNNGLPCKLIIDNLIRNIHTTVPKNAGHSKWANIRHIKALKDGQKSTLFTRYSRQIRIAIQEGGSPDPALNTQLRNIIDNALRKNMPMATIQNCIKKTSASKTLLRKHFLFWRFQQKVFAVCSLYTENFPQIKMELAPILRKSGTVYVEGQHMFDDVGIIEAIASDDVLSRSKSNDDALEQICTEDAIECGVEEIEILDHAKGAVNFLCNPVELGTVSQALEKRGYLIENAEHVFIAKNLVELSDLEKDAYDKFVKRIRELPGIDGIYDNVKVSEA